MQGGERTFGRVVNMPEEALKKMPTLITKKPRKTFYNRPIEEPEDEDEIQKLREKNIEYKEIIIEGMQGQTLDDIGIDNFTMPGNRVVVKENSTVSRKGLQNDDYIIQIGNSQLLHNVMHDKNQQISSKKLSIKFFRYINTSEKKDTHEDIEDLRKTYKMIKLEQIQDEQKNTKQEEADTLKREVEKDKTQTVAATRGRQSLRGRGGRRGHGGAAAAAARAPAEAEALAAVDAAHTAPAPAPTPAPAPAPAASATHPPRTRLHLHTPAAPAPAHARPRLHPRPRPPPPRPRPPRRLLLLPPPPRPRPRHLRPCLRRGRRRGRLAGRPCWSWRRRRGRRGRRWTRWRTGRWRRR